MATTAGEQPAGGELFTRGGRDAPDTRGLSMVRAMAGQAAKSLLKLAPGTPLLH